MVPLRDLTTRLTERSRQQQPVHFASAGAPEDTLLPPMDPRPPLEDDQERMAALAGTVPTPRAQNLPPIQEAVPQILSTGPRDHPGGTPQASHRQQSYPALDSGESEADLPSRPTIPPILAYDRGAQTNPRTPDLDQPYHSCHPELAAVGAPPPLQAASHSYPLIPPGHSSSLYAPQGQQNVFGGELHSSYSDPSRHDFEYGLSSGPRNHEMNFEMTGDGQGEGRGRRRRGNLPRPVTDILRRWFEEHSDHPYPSEEEKQDLMRETQLAMSQISNWFINARRRRDPQRNLRRQQPMQHDLSSHHRERQDESEPEMEY
ncbi:MAG: hypothetical protein M1837_004026 [Sclerophora amabilis]|nr:MAG: hypothetical protein M1837_004026 [Sclerophora amabilis]